MLIAFHSVRAIVRCWALIALVSHLAPAPLEARPKTDVVILYNGDRITCEIKRLERGKLTVSTSDMSTLSIKWDKIARVQSPYRFQLELSSGLRYIGAIEQGDEDGTLVVVGLADPARLELSRIVSIRPLEQSFWQRIDGSIDAGYDFTQAATATTWSLNANALYRTDRYETTSDFSSSIKEQEGANRVNRQTLNVFFNRFFRGRWFATVLGQAEKSENQGLDFRGLMGAAAGRRLKQTNRAILALLGGTAFSREKYQDRDEYETNAEALAALSFETFHFDHPELDIGGVVVVLPNLKTWGRFRVRADAQARIELLKDLYWSVNLYESYDSDPPSATARKNDFGISTSVGWKF